ncbi:MAG: T9SS type A sorting domain-containing protein [Stygiobacter sp.]
MTSLRIYDALGREVATLVNEYQRPGIYSTEFRAQSSELSSGVYFYKLQSGNLFKQRNLF